MKGQSALLWILLALVLTGVLIIGSIAFRQGTQYTISISPQPASKAESNTIMPPVVTRAYDALAEDRRQKLEAGSSDSGAPTELLVPIYPPAFATSQVWSTCGFPWANKSSGKFYYEVDIVGDLGGPGGYGPQLGWLAAAFQAGPGHEAVGFDEYGWSADGTNNRKWNNGHKEAKWPRQWTKGDIIGLALDTTAGQLPHEGKMMFSLNGRWVPEAEMFFAPAGHSFFPAVTSTGPFAFHIGRGSWKYPAPALDYMAWFDASAPIERPSEGRVFEAVEVSFPLAPPITRHDTWGVSFGQGEKNIVGLQHMTRGGRRCVVYGFGIANDAGFELMTQEAGCETHAFDCTVDPSDPVVSEKPFKFHHWCVGRGRGNVSYANSLYVDSIAKAEKLQFKSLSQTMQELGHTYVDILKFDIEGFEWQLFETEILPSGNPPEQLSFELHTRLANPQFVPRSLVEDKGYVQVNRLFRSLFDKGYRVVSKEVNSGDLACAEFILLHVNKGASPSIASPTLLIRKG